MDTRANDTRIEFSTQKEPSLLCMMGMTTDGGKVGQLFMDNHGDVKQNN